jgi:myo-inositol-1(or 4)-monophosphatase
VGSPPLSGQFSKKRLVSPSFYCPICDIVTGEPLTDWLRTCEAAARAGGAQLREWRGRFQTREKGVCDLVTDADFASQTVIRELIAAQFPDHIFVGEEQEIGPIPPRDDQVAWIVDPLDGTTNYVHDYPNYAVSVAAARGSEILVGVIYDPLRDQCFSAAAGRGAWCNGTPLKTSLTARLIDSLVGVSLPARVERHSPDLLDFIEIVQICQSIRRSGSAALNLAHVASGALDAFWASHIHPWDVAAGVLLIREAGGIVTGRNGANFDLWTPHFLAAATPKLHRELLGALTPYSLD